MGSRWVLPPGQGRVCGILGQLSVLLVLVSCGPSEPSSSQAGIFTPRTISTESPDIEKEGKLVRSHLRQSALGTVPKEALFCLQVKNIGGMRESFFDLAMMKAFEHFELASKLTGMPSELGELEELRAKFENDFSAWLEIADGIQGDLVFAFLKVNPASMMRGRDFPGSVMMRLDLGDQRGAVAKQLSDLADSLGELESMGQDHYRLVDSETILDARVLEDALMVWFGPEATADMEIEDILSLQPSQSFVSSEVFEATEPWADPDAPRVECYMNLDTVWQMMSMLAPPEAQVPLKESGLMRVRGFSLMAGFENEGIRERYTWVTPTHNDIFSKLLQAPGIKAEHLGGWLSEAKSGLAWSMNLKQAIDSVLACLPPEVLEDVNRERKQAKSFIGMDPLDDVIGNIGPLFAASMSGDFAKAVEGESAFDFQISFAVKNPGLWRRFLETAEGMATQAGEMTLKSIKGTSAKSVIAAGIPEEFEWLQPTYGLVGNRFVIAANPQLWKQSAASGSSSGNQSPALSKALANCQRGAAFVSFQSTAWQVHNTWSALLDALAIQDMSHDLPSAEMMAGYFADKPDGVTTVKRTEGGWVWDSSSVFGPSPALLVPAAIVSAVAIPNLLEARLSANENAAIAVLRSIASAQAMCQVSGIIDSDRDGVGEYGTLLELAGAIPPPGSNVRVDPPLLSPSLAILVDGCVQRSGFCFQTFLLDSKGRPIPAGEHGGTPLGADRDQAENHWVAYAWPSEWGKTGQRSFMIDHSGEVYESSFPYSGVFAAPEGASAFSSERPYADGQEGGSYREGIDGATWQKMN